MEKEINVVVLDYEENIRESVKCLFFRESFAVTSTGDSQEAIGIIEKHPIKVILSDQRMPQITGVEFLKQVREKFPDVVRILITGHADIQAAEDAINYGGVYRFINKPWNSEELKATVKQAIEHHDLVVQNRELFEATKAKNEELEVLNRRLKGMYETQKEFTSTVSHELRTPLASIKSTVDLVLSGAPGPLTEDQSKFLQKTKNNVDRLNRLINDILDLTKLESGKTELQISFHNLAQLIAEDVDNHAEAAAAKGLTLTTNISDNLPAIPMAVDKIHQVLNNLLSNAIKFTEQGGVMVVCTNNVERNYVEVRVADTGPGISVEDKDKLFQKFQQLGEPHQHTGGTGLGLAICKEIVDRHGGKIWVESQVGEGSCFCFLLPIEERRKG